MAYLFGAICPARGSGAALVMPYVGIDVMNQHLVEIGTNVSPGAIALVLFDCAGWHKSPKLTIPENVVLMKLPPYAPELNPTENIWQYLRTNALANSVWETYDDIVDACGQAWNGLVAKPDVIASTRHAPMGAGQNLGWLALSRARRPHLRLSDEARLFRRSSPLSF